MALYGAKMRFIRVHGHIVPVRDGGSHPAATQKPAQKLNRTNELGRAANVGIAAGSLAHGVASFASVTRNPKAALAASVAGAAVGIGGVVKSVFSARKLAKQEGTSAVGEFALQYGAALAGTVAGAHLSSGALRPALKAKSAIRGGIIKGATALKGQTGKFAEARKFKRAKVVANFKPVRGLLR